MRIDFIENLGGIMSKLMYDELILLDNLIYLDLNAKEGETLFNIVTDIINYGDFDYLMNEVGNCIMDMPHNQWINLLEQIILKPNLKKLRIKNIDTYYNNGMKYACFVDDENNSTVVFRGTTTSDEWEDNGHSAYVDETKEQLDALNFINKLEYENITVTGHSKGGNKAQFVTILSPKISECLSINGQGFSNEFIGRYSMEIDNNKSKIISINAQYDYISCLFNSISGKKHYIKTDIKLNPLNYHKAHILLDESGNLRPETKEAEICNAINDFSTYLISDLPKDISKVIIDKVIDMVELILCKGNKKENVLKVIGEYLLMFCYENFPKYQEIFNICFALIQVLVLPLLFWDDLINIQETKSKELADDIINKINILENEIVKTLAIVDKNQNDLINQVSNATLNLCYRLKNEVMQN